MREARKCLTPLVLQWHMLPQSTGKTNLEDMALKVLRANWKREAVEFPSQFEVVLLHTVNDAIETRHVGLLFRGIEGYTYVEKAGFKGPFIRLDIRDRADLMPWLGGPLRSCTNAACHHFATFNDHTI